MAAEQGAVAARADSVAAMGSVAALRWHDSIRRAVSG